MLLNVEWLREAMVLCAEVRAEVRNEWDLSPGIWTFCLKGLKIWSSHISVDLLANSSSPSHLAKGKQPSVWGRDPPRQLPIAHLLPLHHCLSHNSAGSKNLPHVPDGLCV